MANFGRHVNVTVPANPTLLAQTMWCAVNTMTSMWPKVAQKRSPQTLSLIWERIAMLRGLEPSFVYTFLVISSSVQLNPPWRSIIAVVWSTYFLSVDETAQFALSFGVFSVTLELDLDFFLASSISSASFILFILLFNTVELAPGQKNFLHLLCSSSLMVSRP